MGNKKQPREYESLLTYYKTRNINPVPISLDDEKSWNLHVAKRRNLYERQLGVPLSLLHGRSILEFGCNSGENALVSANAGARITLVEPNDQVYPRLKTLFSKFGLEHRIEEIVNQDIELFETERKYDVVIAEGFLHILDKRVSMLEKICNLIALGGIGIVSFNDLYGSFLEIARKLLFHRICRIEGVRDMHGEESLAVALNLFGDDFLRINVSRPFDAWWRDMLLNPFVVSGYLWTYKELSEILENAGCELYRCSPGWFSVDNFNWYKNVSDTSTIYGKIMDEWRMRFVFMITGMAPVDGGARKVNDEVLSELANLVIDMSGYANGDDSALSRINYPASLFDYLDSDPDPKVRSFNSEMVKVLESVKVDGANDLISVYHNTQYVRHLWGTPYHYISFIRMR